MDTVISAVFFLGWLLWMLQVVYPSLKAQYRQSQWDSFVKKNGDLRLAFELIDKHLTPVIPDTVLDSTKLFKLPNLKPLYGDVYFDYSENSLGLYLMDDTEDTPNLYLLPKKYYPHDKMKRDDSYRRELLSRIRYSVDAGFVPKIKSRFKTLDLTESRGGLLI